MWTQHWWLAPCKWGLCDKASRHSSQKSAVEPFGRHNIFGTSDFPQWPFTCIVTCHDSLHPPPPFTPPPPSEWREQ